MGGLSAVTHLLHPDAGNELISVVGEEGAHVGQECCSQKTVSNQVAHVRLQTLRSHTHTHTDTYTQTHTHKHARTSKKGHNGAVL